MSNAAAITARKLSAAELLAAAKALATAGGGAATTRLLALIYNPDVDIEPVLACINSDPTLAARVLKVANSAYYGCSGEVGTLSRAVQVLGFNTLRSIVAAGCMDRLAPKRTGTAFEPERFRRHSLAVACAAQQLSRSAALGLGDEPFMAGLLHDIGVLLLVKAAPQAMAHYAPVAMTSVAQALNAELAHFGATHETCATVLAQAWRLPPWLNSAVARHHNPKASSAEARSLEALPALISVANHLAHRAGLGFWPICGMPPAPGTLEALGVQEDAAEDIVKRLPEAVSSLAQT